MWSKLKAVALAAVVGAAVLVPLYGDPRSSPVTHAEWARMLLRGLGMDDILQQTMSASQAFSILSWRGSLAFPAAHYVKGDGVEVKDGGVTARTTGGEVSYPVSVVRTGDYRLRLLLAGDPTTPATAEVSRLGETRPVGSFSLVGAPMAGWVEGGMIHLDPGAYTASVILPVGTTLSHVEVAPPCVGAIEPPGGWRSTAVLQSEDVAVTVLKALDLESELPPAAAPIEVRASAFQARGPTVMNASVSETGQGFTLKAGPLGLEAVVFVDIPEEGTHTVSVFGLRGTGQSWLADACRKAVLCPAAQEAGATADWHVVMTAPFTAGKHFLRVVLGAGAEIERLRVERKKDTPADYVATLGRLGFDVGAPGPMPRDRAVDAMRFIETKRAQLQKTDCGDVAPPSTSTVAALAEPLAGAGPAAGPGGAPPFAGVPPPGPGSGPPVPLPSPIPTQPPGSPVLVPAE